MIDQNAGKLNTRDVKKKPYLLKEEKVLQIVEGSKIRGGEHQITISNKSKYLFQ